MSLTSQLKTVGSPVRQYVEFYAAALAGAKRGTPWGPELQRLLRLADLPPKEPALPPGIEMRLRGMAGTAFDYRLRLYLGDPGMMEAAKWGARFAAGANKTYVRRTLSFFANLEELMRSVDVGDEHLSEDDERLVCRYCSVLAEFETVFRSGVYRPTFPSQLTDSPSPYRNEPLLAVAQDPVVDEVVMLSRSVPSAFGPLIYAVREGVPFVSNPVFSGSRDVGGADADFVIGDALFEVKTGAELNTTELRKALLQLVGYVLLDYDDALAVRKLAVYFVRHKWLATWPLWQFVFPLADVLRYGSDGKEPNEAELLERLAVGRQGMREAATAGELPAEL